MADESWTFEPGDLTTRSEVKDLYGGSIFGGIEPSRRTANVMVYSDPSQGEQHGYNYDGWDRSEREVFHYTGEGQVGDQDPGAAGNGAILRHDSDGRALRLFEVASRQRSGGKLQRYIGEFYIDPDDPWRFEDAPDRNGDTRKVVVFRLLAVEPAVSREVSSAPIVAEVSRGREPSAPELSISENLDRRKIVMEWLSARSHDGSEPLSLESLQDFEMGGVSVRLVGGPGDVWSPPGFGGPLSIRNGQGAVRELSQRDGLLRWRPPASSRGGPALRQAMKVRLPLVLFQDVGGGLFLPVFPIYVAAEQDGVFLLALDELYGLVPTEPESPAEEVLRRYARAEVKRRLHQPVFRAMVLRAYRNRCSVCALAHVELLDAAHIVGDSEEQGIAAVRNGLALCKLHHAAFDSHIMGITPSLHVEVAYRILDEVDGPTLKHSLQGRHGQRLMILPDLRAEYPDPELLEQHYELFQRTGGSA